MKIADSTVLVTGANRGLGRALVAEALKRGAKQITDMTKNLNIPKASPESAARAILDGVEREDEEIFPDPMSEIIADAWRGSVVKALQRQFAAYAEQSPVTP
jgi:NAD(P)-dependent dehydrogenase (short-subunit alcohol dehydrogenase family)